MAYSEKLKASPGRPTKYNEEVLQQTWDYLKSFESNIDLGIPFKEELAIKLNVDTDTIGNWASAVDADGNRKYPDFFGAYKRLEQLQTWGLKKNALTGNYKENMAKFLLSAEHGLKETKVLEQEFPNGISITSTSELPSDKDLLKALKDKNKKK